MSEKVIKTILQQIPVIVVKNPIRKASSVQNVIRHFSIVLI